jgi:hypothetical protein
MQRIKAEAEVKLRALTGGKPQWRVLWSYDNDKIHQDTTLQAALKVGGRARAPLPPYSHDIHKVVEHAIGRLKRAYSGCTPTRLSARCNFIWMHCGTSFTHTSLQIVSRRMSCLCLILTAQSSRPRVTGLRASTCRSSLPTPCANLPRHACFFLPVHLPLPASSLRAVLLWNTCMACEIIDGCRGEVEMSRMGAERGGGRAAEVAAMGKEGAGRLAGCLVLYRSHICAWRKNRKSQ